MNFLSTAQKLSAKLLLYSPKNQSWGGVLKTMACVRHKSTEDTDAFDQEIKRTSDILDQPRPRFYGFADWKMYKDYNKRMCVKKHFATRMRLNAIRKNTILPQELQEIAHKEVNELPRNSNPIRVRNRCVMTSRGRGIQGKWRVSRIMWRHFAEYNLLSGVKRATW